MPLSSLIGREREVAALAALIRARRRLVTLVGPGGVGKTRLARQVAADTAHDFDDGAVFVDLAPIRDPNLVIPTIARTIGAHDAGSEAPLVELQRALGPASVLLVLDNLEQVTEAAPSIAELLIVCPSVQILATSREPLRITGEQEFPLAPLELPSADDARPDTE